MASEIIAITVILKIVLMLTYNTQFLLFYDLPMYFILYNYVTINTIIYTDRPRCPYKI